MIKNKQTFHPDVKFVYIITNAAWPGWCKVGVSKDWKKRLNTYQTSSPHRDYKIEFVTYPTEAYRHIEQDVLVEYSLFSNNEWILCSVKELSEFITKRYERYK